MMNNSSFLSKNSVDIYLLKVKSLNFPASRFITREELKQAMSEYGMGDEAAIDEVINDVDTDKVSLGSVWFLFFKKNFCSKKDGEKGKQEEHGWFSFFFFSLKNIEKIGV